MSPQETLKYLEATLKQELANASAFAKRVDKTRAAHKKALDDHEQTQQMISSSFQTVQSTRDEYVQASEAQTGQEGKVNKLRSQLDSVRGSMTGGVPATA